MIAELQDESDLDVLDVGWNWVDDGMWRQRPY
jgi:hypothetical protein